MPRAAKPKAEPSAGPKAEPSAEPTVQRAAKQATVPTANRRAAPKRAADAPRSRIWQINEAAILGGAERVFARAGFEGATMAQIAEEAGVPKPNLHYYFGGKLDLYRAVLDRVLHDWLEPTEVIVADAEPRVALEAYVRRKMALAFARPDASRVFANELLHGAPVIGERLRGELRATVLEKSRIIDGWIAAGKMSPVDSPQLFFTLWASTQTYADFDVQIRAVMGAQADHPAAQQRATEHVLTIMLRACGLEDAGAA